MSPRIARSAIDVMSSQQKREMIYILVISIYRIFSPLYLVSVMKTLSDGEVNL